MPKTGDSLEATFELVAKLLELHDDNVFKIKSFSSAARAIDALGPQSQNLTDEEWKAVSGIGASHLKRIRSFQSTGSFDELDELLKRTPEGLLEVMAIRGLGVKKVRTLWRNLGIESLSELIYACEENRLTALPGFGLKTQQNVKEAAEFLFLSRGKMRLDKAEKALNELAEVAPDLSWKAVGEYSRHLPVIERLEILVDRTIETETNLPPNVLSNPDGFIWLASNGLSVEAIWKNVENSGYQLLKLTGPEAFISDLGAFGGDTEKEVLKQNNRPWLSPELRDSSEFYQLGDPVGLVSKDGWQGCLHNHTTWSDGHHSLKEMVQAAVELGWSWLGIADHSRSATYANGLSEERLLAQIREIDLINESLNGNFRVLKGVESDILSDGSLDYPNEILKQLDYVVASVHIGLRMEKEKATTRLLNAIRNPYTSVLGHLTGRLLLGREGYPLNMEQIFEACSEHCVAIEINAHPYRLDLDWKYVGLAQSMGVKIIINPDAHQINGLKDVRFGLGIARKGGLLNNNCLNFLPTNQLFHWLDSRVKG